jgi:hypothetical protein
VMNCCLKSCTGGDYTCQDTCIDTYNALLSAGIQEDYTPNLNIDYKIIILLLIISYYFGLDHAIFIGAMYALFTYFL